MSKIKTAWFKNKTAREKEEITYVLQNNVLLREALFSILDQMREAEERKEIQSNQYENPSWAYRQADINGAKRILQDVRALFIFD